MDFALRRSWCALRVHNVLRPLYFKILDPPLMGKGEKQKKLRPGNEDIDFFQRDFFAKRKHFRSRVIGSD